MINTTILKVIGVLLLAASIYAAGYLSRNGEISDLKAQMQVYKGKLQELADTSKRAEERIKAMEKERAQQLSKLSQSEKNLEDAFNSSKSCQDIVDNVRRWSNGNKS